MIGRNGNVQREEAAKCQIKSREAARMNDWKVNAAAVLHCCQLASYRVSW